MKNNENPVVALLEDQGEQIGQVITTLKDLSARVEQVENVNARPGGIGETAATARDEETGATVHALAPNQSVRAHLVARQKIEAQNPHGGRAGDLVRAMVMGPRNEHEIRALHEGADASGGYAVQEQHAAEVIDLMRKKAVCIQAGARTVPLESDKTHYLRIAADPVAAWRLERGQVAASDMTFGRMTFVPRSLAVLLKASRELFEDAPNTAETVENALAMAMAIEVDRVGLLGSGVDPEPRGVANTPGISAYELGADGAMVSAGKWKPILRARQKLLEANGAEPTAAVMAPRTSTAFEELTDANDQPLQRPRAIEALPFLSTTQIPTDEDQGASAGVASRVIVGDYSNLWFGVRTGFRVELLRELYAETMEIGILAYLRLDVQVAQPAAFCDIPGFLPEAA